MPRLPPGYGACVSEPGHDSNRDEPLSVTDIASEETSDGGAEWCFSVQGLDDTVQAARFATRREAEKAHQRLKRALELLGQQPRAAERSSAALRNRL